MPTPNAAFRTGMSRESFRFQFRALLDSAGLALVLIGLVAFFGLTTDHFFTSATFRTIANQIPDAVVIAAGMTFVLIIGGIDLSVGSVLALGGAILGVCMNRWGWPLPAALAACIGTGVVCGALNGLVVVGWNLPSFIVTLGMLEAARGGAYLIARSQTHYIGGALDGLAAPQFLGLSASFLLALAVVALGQIFLSGTAQGRHLFAIGANEESARLSGIPTRRIKFAVFSVAGFLSALAAPMYCARLSAANPNDAQGYELQAIAAVVIGGTSLMGGRGSVVNSLLGVLIIKVLENGLYQIGAQLPTQRLVTGAVIVAAVIIDVYRRRLGSATGRKRGATEAPSEGVRGSSG